MTELVFKDRNGSHVASMTKAGDMIPSPGDYIKIDGQEKGRVATRKYNYPGVFLSGGSTGGVIEFNFE